MRFFSALVPVALLASSVTANPIAAPDVVELEARTYLPSLRSAVQGAAPKWAELSKLGDLIPKRNGTGVSPNTLQPLRAGMRSVVDHLSFIFNSPMQDNKPFTNENEARQFVDDFLKNGPIAKEALSKILRGAPQVQDIGGYATLSDLAADLSTLSWAVQSYYSTTMNYLLRDFGRRFLDGVESPDGPLDLAIRAHNLYLSEYKKQLCLETRWCLP